MPQSFQLLEPQPGADRLKDFATKPAVMIGGGLIALLLFFSISVSMSGRGTTLGAGGPQPSFNTVSLHLQLAQPKPVLMQHLWYQPLAYPLPTHLLGRLGPPGQRELPGWLPCHHVCPYDHLAVLTCVQQNLRDATSPQLFTSTTTQALIKAPPERVACAAACFADTLAQMPFEVQVERCQPLISNAATHGLQIFTPCKQLPALLSSLYMCRQSFLLCR